MKIALKLLPVQLNMNVPCIILASCSTFQGYRELLHNLGFCQVSGLHIGNVLSKMKFRVFSPIEYLHVMKLKLFRQGLIFFKVQIPKVIA